MSNVPSHQENLTILAQLEDREAETGKWRELHLGVCQRLPTTGVPSCMHTAVVLCCGPWPLLSQPSFLPKHMIFSRHLDHVHENIHGRTQCLLPNPAYKNFVKNHSSTSYLCTCNSLFSLSFPFFLPLPSSLSLPPSLSELFIDFYSDKLLSFSVHLHATGHVFLLCPELLSCSLGLCTWLLDVSVSLSSCLFSHADLPT